MMNISDQQVVDLSCLEEYTDGDPDMIRELVCVFHETVDEGLGVLKDNITEGENTDWADAAHKLKGATAYMGAEKMKALCAQAQEMKVASQDDRIALYQQIRKAYEQVCDALKEL